MGLNLANFKARLGEELAKVSNRKQRTKEEIVETTGELRRQAADEGEQSELNHRVSVSVGLCESSNAIVKKIGAAIQRIDQGTFGECANPNDNPDCEEFISEKRLEAVPWQETCLNCQEMAEKQASLPKEIVKDLFYTQSEAN